MHAFTSSRAGGVSHTPFDDGSGSGNGGLNLGTHVGDDLPHVIENRARLRAILPSTLTWLTQVHGSTVVRLNGGYLFDIDSNAKELVADASFTTDAGVVCAVMTADCLPILLADRAGSAVGAAHAGWRGLAGGVIQATVAAMRRAGAGELTAWLGPAIGPTAFEVGGEVRDAFVTPMRQAAAAFRTISGKDGKFMADIYLLSRMILASQGIEEVSGGDRCTYRESDRFFSYRRDGITGRMASVIWID